MDNTIIKERLESSGAVWSDAGDGLYRVPAGNFRQLAEFLRNEGGFDFLRSLTGMDWGEDGLGCVYHLENTSTGENIVLAVADSNRDEAAIPSVHDLWKGANLNEREAYDFFGIKFIGHPDLRRLFLRDDWKGHPLRKDYDESLNPLNMETSNVISTYVYEVGLINNDYGYSTAVGLFNTIINVALLLGANLLCKKTSGESLF